MTVETKESEVDSNYEQPLSVAECVLILDALRQYGRAYDIRRATLLADAIQYTSAGVCRFCESESARGQERAGGLVHRCWGKVDTEEGPEPGEPG